jgi:hypothetical protein
MFGSHAAPTSRGSGIPSPLMSPHTGRTACKQPSQLTRPAHRTSALGERRGTPMSRENAPVPSHSHPGHRRSLEPYASDPIKHSVVPGRSHLSCPLGTPCLTIIPRMDPHRMALGPVQLAPLRLQGQESRTWSMRIGTDAPVQPTRTFQRVEPAALRGAVIPIATPGSYPSLSRQTIRSCWSVVAG